MSPMTDAQRDEFLADRRYAILTTLRADGTPVSVPVWYEWDRSTLRMFCHQASGKMRRLKQDARASVLVVNHPDEPENWVAFDGRISIHQEGGLELAERVFDLYYPPGDGRRSELESWRKMKNEWRLLELTPDAIRVAKD
jgi:PPOX class probable F420-dependent enzyme